MQNGVTVVIEVRALPGKGSVLRDELAALARTVIETEPDCLDIEMLQGDDDDTRILMYERWTTREAYAGPHVKTPHMTAFVERAGGFSAGPPTISYWRSLEDMRR